VPAQIDEGSGFDIVVREEAGTAWPMELSGGFELSGIAMEMSSC
jgi:hypothetical protein